MIPNAARVKENLDPIDIPETDGGEITISNGSCYGDLICILVSNGYDVSIHPDIFGKELTISFWK